MKKLLCIIWLLFPLWATAQINVTAIVKDSNSNLYAGGFGSVSLVVPPSATPQPLYNGSVFQTQTIFNIDSFGNLNGPSGINLYDNAIITPSGTQWKFSICMTNAAPWKGQPCFNTTLTITGSSPQNITTQLQSAAALLNNAVISNFTVLTNSVPNLSQVSIDFRTSSTNAVGLTVTPVNTTGGQERFEITGGYTGNAATATALATTPTQCTGANFATGIAASGNANCSTPSSVGTVTSIGLTGTANQITVTGSTPITSSGSWALSLSPTIALGTDNTTAGTLTLANSAAAAHTIFASAATTTNTIKGFATVPTNGHVVTCAVSSTTCTLTDGGVAALTIASGATAMGTGSISANSCATVVTASATGVATTDVISFTPNQSIKALTGYTPAGTLTIVAYPTANNVNFDVCNRDQTNAVTPSALTLNWRVSR